MNESSKSRAKWLIIFGIIVFALIMFRHVLVPGYCLFTTDDNIGQIKLGKDGLPGAFLGSWSDSVYLGMPGGIAPFMWNALLIGLTPVSFYISWVHAFDLTLASWFLLLFLRERKVGWVAIGLGFLTAFWLGSNLTLTYAGHIGKYGVVMFAGASLYCLSRALSQKTSILWSIMAGSAIGFMFLEQLDVALFFGFVLGAYALFLAVRQWQANGAWAKSAVALILMGGVGLLLSASTMFSSYTTNVKGAVSMQTESPQEKWDYVTQWSWPPDECIDFIAPGYMGWRSGEPEGPYWGRMGRSAGWERTQQGFVNFKLENMYLGIIPIILALFAILAGVMGIKRRGSRFTVHGSAVAKNEQRREQVKEVHGSQFTVDVPSPACGPRPIFFMVRRLASGVRCLISAPICPHAHTFPILLPPDIEHSFPAERRAEIIFWGCVAGITLLLAFGKFFPLYALFYKLPLVSSIRNPNKFLQVFQLVLGILAAYGLDGMLRWKRVEREA